MRSLSVTFRRYAVCRNAYTANSFSVAGYEHLRFQSVFLVEMPPDSGFQHLVGHIMNLSGLLYPTTCKLFRPQPLEHRVFLRIECQVEQYDFRPVRKLDAVVRYPVVCESVGIGDLAERDQHGFAAILDVVSADEPARFRELPQQQRINASRTPTTICRRLLRRHRRRIGFAGRPSGGRQATVCS